MNLERIYQQTILDYNNRKDLKKELDDPTYIERGHNPNCGDDLTLEVRLSEDKIVEDASFLGNGCAISTASTAMLIDMIKGKSLENAKEKVELYFKMMKQDEKLTADETKKLGKLIDITENDVIIEETTGKGKKAVTQQHIVPFTNIKTTTVQIKF